MKLSQIYEEVEYQLSKLNNNIKDLFDITHGEIEDDLQNKSLFAINIRINKLRNDSMDILIIISEKIIIDAKNDLTIMTTNVCELIGIYLEIKKNINNFVRISIIAIDNNINLLYFNIIAYLCNAYN
jgi:hypothetical protein